MKEEITTKEDKVKEDENKKGKEEKGGGKTSKIRLSATSLRQFIDCPRCFWISKKLKIDLGGIFPSVTRGIDVKLKEYFDYCRERKTAPDFLKDNIVDVSLFPDMDKMKKMRHWASGLSYKLNEDCVIIGAFDDLIMEKNLYTPFDFKSKGGPATLETSTYNQFQLDLYSFLLQQNGYELSGNGYLGVFYPSVVETLKDVKNTVNMKMKVDLLKLKVHPETILKIAQAAFDCLNGPIPDSFEKCNVCNYIKKTKEALQEKMI